MSNLHLRWIVSYDIRCPNRLARLARFLSRHAFRLQYSVFIGKWTRKELQSIIVAIKELINEAVDDVRCYPVEDEPWHAVLGRQRWSTGWVYLLEQASVAAGRTDSESTVVNWPGLEGDGGNGPDVNGNLS